MEDQADKFRQQKKYNSLLLLGAARGYFKDVEALVELGAALDFKDKKGLTALHYAAGNGRLDAVKFLWSKGAEMDSESPDGCTPLHLAALRGHPEAVTFLLQKGAWIDAEDAQDNTPMHLAASRGHVTTVETLLKHGAKPRGVNKHGLTPLGVALVKGQVEAAQRLLSWGAGAGLDERPGGFSLLHLVAGTGQAAAAQMLLDHGADVNDCSNPEAATPLHGAVLSGDAVCVETLLQAGADASVADAAGKQPIDLLPEGDATKPGAQICELLLAAAKKGGGRKAGQVGKPSVAAPKTPHEAFRALSDKERRSKVELWATLGPADLAAALSSYPAGVTAELSQRIQQLQALRSRINIQKALAAAHADDEFQADAAQPHVRDAIEALRKDPSKYEQYTGDPVILSVLGKMRRLHGVCQANGQRTLALEDALPKPGSNYQEEDTLQGAALAAEYEGQLAAAAAAAAASEGEAAATAEEAYALRRAAARAESKEQPQSHAPKSQVAAGIKEVAALRQKPSASGAAAAAGGAGGRGRGASASAADEAAAEAIRKLEARGKEEEDDAKLPEWMKGGFSWKKVWLEFWQQTQLAMLMLLAFGIISWLLRGRPPWEGAPRGVAAPAAAAGQSGMAGEHDSGDADLHIDL